MKVLHDVTAMFAPEFVNELNASADVPQYATRKLFDKLVHTSIMRLSESSMDKLHDLMTISKFQLATCESRDLNAAAAQCSRAT